MDGAFDYTYDPQNPGVPGDKDHSWYSAEWQSAAVLEGFAHLYAASAWSDIDRVGAVPFVEMGSIEMNAIVRPVPRTGGCVRDDGADEDAGIANEWNWVSALRAFRVDANDTPGLELLLGMLGQAYDGGQADWVASGEDSEFWDNFVAQMAAGDYLSSSQQGDWANAATAWCIDH